MEGLTESLAKLEVLVVGDAILDRYVSGDIPRISPEAPVPVVWVSDEEERVGGAANVAANMASLGGKPWLSAVVGSDDAGRLLREQVRATGVGVSGLRTDRSRPTVQKTRIVARHQQVIRVDRENPAPLSPAMEKRIVADLEARAGKVQAVVLSDYGKGLLTPAVIQAALALGVDVLVDPKGADYRRYRGASLITPNAREASLATGCDTSTEAGCREAARALFKIGRFGSVVITRGDQGIYYRTRAGKEGRIPTRARSVFDVTGAGDTVIAVLAMGCAAGFSLEYSVELANAAAGLVVQRFGAAVITPAELIDTLRESSLTGAKITTLAGAEAHAMRLQAEGRRLVLTNGCFDLLHVGHVESLEFAKAQGDFLCVAVNDDDSVRRQKGPMRPVQELKSRMRVLAGLACVDLVFPFAEDTPERIIHAISPRVLVKGEDWKNKGVVGQDWVLENGGRVVLAPITAEHSTSAIIDRIRRDDAVQRRTQG